MRRPHLGVDLKVSGDVGQVQLVQANVRNRESVARALENADAVVNLVGILYERGAQSFQETQAQGTRNIAEEAAKAGVSRFVQISSIGADPKSRSRYQTSKAEAEAAVLAAIPTATILRPSILFGQEDGFFGRFAGIAKASPIMPVIGGGTRFQPVFAGDVADAVAQALTRTDARGRTYELGGPRIYTMKELLTFLLKQIDRPRLMLPVPASVAQPMAYVVGALSRLNPLFGPPITGDQVQNLKIDNVAQAGMPGFKELGLSQLETLEAIAPTYLWRHRPQGQFHKVQEEDLSRVDV
jgi:NADH dehydrogenase